MKTNKPNRIHKATGLIAEHWESSSHEWYIIKGTVYYLPVSVVEVEGGDWEEEKSEIDELIKKLDDTCVDFVSVEQAKYLILEFAKNYKDQGK